VAVSGVAVWGRCKDPHQLPQDNPARAFEHWVEARQLVGIHELFANMFAGAMFAKMFGRAPVTVAYPDDEMLFSMCLHHLEYPGLPIAQEQIIEGTKMYLNGGHPFGM